MTREGGTDPQFIWRGFLSRNTSGSRQVDLSDPSAKGASKDELLKTSEPKWKQKLAAADEHAERVRQLTLQAEKEYKNRQMLLQQERGIGFHDVVPLNELEFLTYLTEEGIINDCGEVDAKATVYAVFDEQKNLQYVGITRQVYHSMRLHFARVPKKCFYVKILHVSRPNRLLLERIRTAWIVENGGAPMGNDNGPHQNIWENPLDCKPLMTEEEEQKFKEVPAGPVQAKFLKDVARRIEKGILAGFAERNCKEKLWFDPKLKEKGLLDLKNEKTQLDACVPTTNFKLASTTKT
ncbi:hypothetical protein O6H91_Y577100 [Diphasiastrum complanatum]|nr:hypothetical protein O6H91_Y577100 [Diphasiastrum complanatum]